MKKLKTNQNYTSHNNKCKIEANCACHNSRGITLIALVITIIVMLILVGVTIAVAINGGLIDKTKEATSKTNLEIDRETLTGAVIGAMNNQGVIEKAEDIKLPEGWREVIGQDGGPYTVTSPNGNVFTVESNGKIVAEGETPPSTLPDGWNEDAISEIITETVDGVEYKVPIPKGYVASKATGENTVAEGLVIYEGTEEVNDSNVQTAMSTRNQFVWIPVSEELTTTYNNGATYSEPTEITVIFPDNDTAYDSQETLDYLYGVGYYDYATDFAYSTHYTEMVESVNKYHGFYIGRYETTIDENNEIGSKYNTTVLSSSTKILQTNNKESRWYGLYYVQKNDNMLGNNNYLQTSMVTGQQWDKMIEYLDIRKIDYSGFGKSKQGKVVKSGQSTNNAGEKDEIYNIYDLRTNCYEWTTNVSTTVSGDSRKFYGGNYSSTNASASDNNIAAIPTKLAEMYSSRLTLYIK